MSVNETRIHIVYLVISQLLSSLICKFVKSEFLRGDSNNVKSLTELLTLNIKDNKKLQTLDINWHHNWVKSSFSRILRTRNSGTFDWKPIKRYFLIEIDIAMGINKVKKCFLSWPRKERMKGPWMLQSV